MVDESKLREAFVRIKEQIEFIERRLTILETSRLGATSHPTKSTIVDYSRPSAVSLSSFTPQEKIIISVLLKDRDRQLSYRDIGVVLNKSPSTIKNQLRQIKDKCPGLFNETVDPEQQKRYQIKKGIELSNTID